jgi:hypothetical protein
MAPLQQELSSLEVEPLEIVVCDPGREGFDTVGSQDVSLETLTTLSDVEVAALLTGKGAFPVNGDKCCCCCPTCCCGCCCCL